MVCSTREPYISLLVKSALHLKGNHSCCSSQIKDYEDSIPQVGLIRLLQANAREAPLIVLGILGSFFEGSAFPVFAIFFAEILRVSPEK